MEDKDLSKFRVKLLNATKYFAWSNDMEIIFRGKGLWKFVERPSEVMGRNKEVQKRDLHLAYIRTSASGGRKPVRMIRCPNEARNKLRRIFLAVSEVAVDGKLPRLENIELNKEKRF